MNAVGASGATSNQTLLRRYTDGILPACGGPCGWTQDISYYGDDQDTHYNALQMTVTKTMTTGSQRLTRTMHTSMALINANSFATWNKQAVNGNDRPFAARVHRVRLCTNCPLAVDQMLPQ